MPVKAEEAPPVWSASQLNLPVPKSQVILLEVPSQSARLPPSLSCREKAEMLAVPETSKLVETEAAPVILVSALLGAIVIPPVVLVKLLPLRLRLSTVKAVRPVKAPAESTSQLDVLTMPAAELSPKLNWPEMEAVPLTSKVVSIVVPPELIPTLVFPASTKKVLEMEATMPEELAISKKVSGVVSPKPKRPREVEAKLKRVIELSWKFTSLLKVHSPAIVSLAAREAGPLVQSSLTREEEAVLVILNMFGSKDSEVIWA